ncbi:hypothetical protein DK847_00285 [Aestuariivirga litoralis]|uniref:Cytochrome c domain-containing protein n=1 Tax=Aestuariivirga litoralis TaxID=2650924 RepID=A0A2W2ASK3_9HYPH|nr:c-type cytochrome [Aestuariivirga litoralis]PZF78301.1 hypothetical protein DK847_00285 [Aestuariivirga litoralis]
MTKSRLLACCLALAGVLLATDAGAYDLNNGRLLASNCTQCHSTNVLPKTGGYDSLVGESYSEIYGELREFKQKFNATTKTCTENDPKECLMAVHAMPYTDKEMQDIAWYLSQR